MPVLVALSGLPGVGKTSISKHLAVATSLIHMRVDTIEAALKRSTLQIPSAEDAGYLAAASIASDNLLLGHSVIADTVNPDAFTRDLWADVAASSQSQLLNVEVICSDKVVHRHRVEHRTSDIAGLVVPNWQAVRARDFEAWSAPRVIVDTSVLSAEQCAEKIAEHMKSGPHVPISR